MYVFVKASKEYIRQYIAVNCIKSSVFLLHMFTSQKYTMNVNGFVVSDLVSVRYTMYGIIESNTLGMSPVLDFCYLQLSS